MQEQRALRFNCESGFPKKSDTVSYHCSNAMCLKFR